MHLSIYIHGNIKKSIYCDDKSGFLRLPSRYCRSYFRWLFTFLTLENRVIAPLNAQTPQHVVTFMKTFHTFLTILTSPIRSEDRQE